MINQFEDKPLIKVDSLKRILKTGKYTNSLLGMGFFSVIGLVILLFNRFKMEGSFSMIIGVYTGICLLFFLLLLIIPLISFILLPFISSLLNFVSYTICTMIEIIVKSVEEYYKINITDSKK